MTAGYVQSLRALAGFDKWDLAKRWENEQDKAYAREIWQENAARFLSLPL